MENNQADIRVEETAQGASVPKNQVGIRWPEAKRTSAGTAQGTSVENNQANNRGQEVKRIQWGSSSGGTRENGLCVFEKMATTAASKQAIDTVDGRSERKGGDWSGRNDVQRVGGVGVGWDRRGNLRKKQKNFSKQ